MAIQIVKSYLNKPFDVFNDAQELGEMANLLEVSSAATAAAWAIYYSLDCASCSGEDSTTDAINASINKAAQAYALEHKEDLHSEMIEKGIEILSSRA